MSKMGRNDPCSCGSGKKYKACCLKKTEVKGDFLSHKNRKISATIASDSKSKLGHIFSAVQKCIKPMFEFLDSTSVSYLVDTHYEEFNKVFAGKVGPRKELLSLPTGDFEPTKTSFLVK